MVEADSAELAFLSVEEETLVRTHLNGPESESCRDPVMKICSVSDAYFRSLHIPVGVDCSSGIDFCISVIQ